MAHAKTPSIRRAPEMYSKEEEDFFRRELENHLLIAIYYAAGIASGTDPQASLTMKRADFLPPVGVVVIG